MSTLSRFFNVVCLFCALNSVGIDFATADASLGPGHGGGDPKVTNFFKYAHRIETWMQESEAELLKNYPKFSVQAFSATINKLENSFKLPTSAHLVEFPQGLSSFDVTLSCEGKIKPACTEVQNGNSVIKINRTFAETTLAKDYCQTIALEVMAAMNFKDRYSLSSKIHENYEAIKCTDERVELLEKIVARQELIHQLEREIEKVKNDKHFKASGFIALVSGLTMVTKLGVGPFLIDSAVAVDNIAGSLAGGGGAETINHSPKLSRFDVIMSSIFFIDMAYFVYINQTYIVPLKENLASEAHKVQHLRSILEESM